MVGRLGGAKILSESLLVYFEINIGNFTFQNFNLYWAFCLTNLDLVNIRKYTRFVPKVYGNFEDEDELPIFMSLGGQPGKILILMCELRCQI